MWWWQYGAFHFTIGGRHATALVAWLGISAARDLGRYQIDKAPVHAAHRERHAFPWHCLRTSATEAADIAYYPLAQVRKVFDGLSGVIEERDREDIEPQAMLASIESWKVAKHGEKGAIVVCCFRSGRQGMLRVACSSAMDMHSS